METEAHQRRLLIALVDADLAHPRDQRPDFAFIVTFQNQARIHHPSLPKGGLPASPADIQDLTSADFLSPGRSPSLFSITGAGFRAASESRERLSEPEERVEAEILEYLSTEDFQRRHAAAHAGWRRAEALALHADSDHDLTSVGHLCREALQAFAADLVSAMGAVAGSTRREQTVARIRMALNALPLGDTERPFLEALVAYWGTLTDLVQMQEHGASKEGRRLVREDARRVVFQTLLVMLEIDRVSIRHSV